MLKSLLSRGTAMFVLGSFGFVHEVLIEPTERPFVLALSGYLMGLPFVIAADRLPRIGNKDET